MAKPRSENALEMLLAEAEKEVTAVETGAKEADLAVIREVEAIEAGKTAIELEIERDILGMESDLARKIETELWNGAHISLLPFFYDTYTVGAQIEPALQAKYNHATLAACSRFKALGERGLAMVAPVIEYIHNSAVYTPTDRLELDRELQARIVAWLKLDIVPEARPRQQLARSLETVVSDIVEAEQVFVRSSPEAVYMEGTVQMAAVKAIRSSMFLPNQVKISLLQALSSLSEGEIFDIGTFLLWEIRKSSHHRELLLAAMLRLLNGLNRSLI